MPCLHVVPKSVSAPLLPRQRHGTSETEPGDPLGEAESLAELCLENRHQRRVLHKQASSDRRFKVHSFAAQEWALDKKPDRKLHIAKCKLMLSLALVHTRPARIPFQVNEQETKVQIADRKAQTVLRPSLETPNTWFFVFAETRNEERETCINGERRGSKRGFNH
ncbi:hypothetical protein EG329_001669 [Mollisiaceae sp. DMI_Dod_QoI]|nr:hypothetical protein EG329_001669 [Helotiales sp. DMI_Dod_QoI]